MNKNPLIIIVILIYCGISPSYLSAASDSLSSKPKKSYVKTINYGVNKLVNTFLFTGNANLNFDVIYGDISIGQKYKGTALRSSETSFRDDENFNFLYTYGINDNISILAKQKWLYSSDSRVDGINELDRLNALGGLQYNFSRKSYIMLAAGLERNTQVNVKSSGSIIQVDGKILNEKIYDMNFESFINGEFVNLDTDIDNNDFTLKTSLSRIYDRNNMIYIGLNYKFLNRGFFSLSDNLSAISSVPAQLRQENTLGFNVNLDFAFTDNIVSGIDFSMNNMDVERSYQGLIENNDKSAIYRDMNDGRMNFSSDLSYKSESFFQKFTLAFETIEVEADIRKNFNISTIDFNELATEEDQYDVSSSRTTLSSMTLWNIGSSDTLNVNYSMSLFQFDSPSELNNEDRDELKIYLKTEYQHRFSNLMRAKLTGEVQFSHRVYIKAARSRDNTWDRVVRFMPEIEYSGKRVYFNPKLAVLANYKVYDFEDIVTSIESFSLRQIQYNDSIRIKLSSKTHLETGINFRYYETGRLFWKSFSEVTQSKNYELFCNTLLFYDYGNFLKIGAGMRYFRLNQEQLKSVELINQSVGPETEIRAEFKNGGYISLNGWYEFQHNEYNGEINLKTIPNFFILAKVLL